MNQTTLKLSKVMRDLSERLLRNPNAAHSSEAANVALMFANIAWNETVGLDHARESYRSAWETIEADNPLLWSELKSTDVSAMLNELVEYKRRRYPDDHRRILICGILDSKIHVEWLNPAAPGVDSRWEMQLYGMVRTGQRERAIEFLRRTRKMSRNEAVKQIKKIAASFDLM